MASSQFAQGSTVFVPDEQEAYLPARVASCQGFGATAILRVTPVHGGGAERVVPAKELPLVCDADPLSLEGANDLVKYTQLTDAAVLHGLRARYARDDIYTCAGSILVSVNPFKQVPSYGDALMARCKAAGAKELHEMPPHVFVVAESAFRGMLSEGKQQAILISGGTHLPPSKAEARVHPSPSLRSYPRPSPSPSPSPRPDQASRVRVRPRQPSTA